MSPAGWPPGPGTWVIDLDGVVWLAGQPIEGAAEGVEHLRTTGRRVLFATNNSSPTLDELVARLERCGIAAGPDDLVTSAQAAATLVEPGARVQLVGDAGLREAMTARGAVPVDDPPADAVVVGWTHDFDFARLAHAATVVRSGARLIGTNEDPTHPTPDGLLPGAGALLAAVATAAVAVPEVAGKPHPAMARLVAARARDAAAVVGDRLTTDGALARQLGLPFALVTSEATADAPAGEGSPPVAAAADGLGALVAAL